MRVSDFSSKWARITVLLVTLSSVAGVSLGQTVLHDPLLGSTQGTQYGGTLTVNGWRPNGWFDHLTYTLPQVITNGAIEFDVTGLVPDATDYNYGGKGDLFNMWDASQGTPWNDWDSFYQNPYLFYFRKYGTGDASNKTKYLIRTAVMGEDVIEAFGSALAWNASTTYRLKFRWSPGNMRIYRDAQMIHNISFPGTYAPVSHGFSLGNGAINASVPNALYSNLIAYHGDAPEPTPTPPDVAYIDLGDPDVAEGMTHPQNSDGDTQPGNIGSRDCKTNVTAGSDNYFYFGVNEDFIWAGNYPECYVELTYYDAPDTSYRLDYDSNTGSQSSDIYRSGGQAPSTGSNTWRFHTWHLTDAFFGNRQNASADFRIGLNVTSHHYIDKVRVSLTPFGTPTPTDTATDTPTGTLPTQTPTPTPTNTPALTGITSLTLTDDGQRVKINGKATYLRGYREGYVGGKWNECYWNHEQCPPDHPVSPNAAQVDHDAYVAYLKNHGLNYARIVGIHMQAGDGRVHGTNERGDAYNYPPTSPYTRRPWLRTGPGVAWDGMPKYDLNQFDPWYFNRLEEFVRKCNENMIVVQFAFFHQHNVYQIFTHYADNPLRPYNNINNTGLPDGFGQTGYPHYYSLTNATVKGVQDAFVTKVMDTIGKYPGVIYHIVDEYNWYASWIEHFADLIHAHGTAHGRQYICQAGGSLAILDDLAPGDKVQSIECTFFGVKSPTDICDPPSLVNQRLAGHCGYSQHPPPSDFYQTYDVVYNTFRYLNDPWDNLLLNQQENYDEWWAGLVAGGGGMYYIDAFWDGGQGYTAHQAKSIETFLPHMVNYDYDVANDSVIAGSSGWTKAIASPGIEYVAFLKTGGWVDLDLRGVSGTFTTRWYNPVTRQFSGQGSTTGGAVRRMTAPDANEWVLQVFDPFFVPTPTPTPTVGIKGDLDGDQDADLFDVLRLVDILLERPPEPSPYQLWAGDMDNDGDSDLFDILALIDMLLGRR